MRLNDKPSIFAGKVYEIVRTIPRGRVTSYQQVARALGLSERTVKFHLECAYLRLGVANRAEAVVRALRQGLIRIPVAGTADTR